MSSYIYKQLYREALDAIRDGMARSGARPEEIAGLDKGDPRDLIKQLRLCNLEKLKESARKGERISPLTLASAYIKVGDKDLALEWLGKVVTEHLPALVFLNVNRQWKDLRPDPRFGSLVQQTGL